MLKRILKYFGGVILLFVTYFIGAWFFAYIPYNTDFKQCETNAIEIYIRTNGFHTDLVVPIQNEQKNWTEFINPLETSSRSANYNWVAFGWGDKGFYLETPSWSDLKFKTAFNALFYLGSSAMHVSFYKQLKENKSCKKIRISPDNYKKLTAFIESSFKTHKGIPKLIRDAAYNDNDLFFDAKGSYSMFYTCNTWANEGLKSSDLKACLWTLFDTAIFDKY